jgi:glycosyltransferase involved in cell wall biosynthesis
MRPEAVQPVPHAQRDIDLLMVANFAKFKRHFALFRAVRHLPRSWRIHLIGQAQDGRTAETARALAEAYGVGDRFTIQSDARHDEVARAFARSRLSLILSKREGSCVVVAESMFADTPVGVLEGAELGSRTFINPQTGRLLKEGNLAGQLIAFHARSAEFAPRAWAVENISCHRSIAVLNEFLRRLSLDQGQEWTQDILAMCRRPDPRLIRPEDWQKVAPARQTFLTRWGLELGHDDSPMSAPHDRA